MKISKSEVGEITVLELKGKITIGAGDVQLREAIEEAARGGATKLVVNLKGVSKMDSSGLGELVSAYNKVTEDGGKIKLANLPSKVYNVLGVAQMISVFEVFESLDEALGSFEG
jgi:anti-sigma B factor antagonist